MKPDHVIFGVHVTDRLHHAGEIQKVFTEYGCNIKTRIGLHEVHPQFSSPEGIVLLEMVGDPTTLSGMKAKLEAIEGIELQEMVFGH